MSWTTKRFQQARRLPRGKFSVVHFLFILETHGEKHNPILPPLGQPEIDVYQMYLVHWICLFFCCAHVCWCLLLLMFAGTVVLTCCCIHNLLSGLSISLKVSSTPGQFPTIFINQNVAFIRTSILHQTAPHLLDETKSQNPVLFHRCRYNGCPTCHRVRSTCIDCSFFAPHAPQVIQWCLRLWNKNVGAMGKKLHKSIHRQQISLRIWHFRRAWRIAPCVPGQCPPLCCGLCVCERWWQKLHSNFPENP